MAYFITGGTGFIGRNFIDKLASREGDIYVLTRAGSMHKFEELQERMGGHGDRLIPVKGDLTEPLLGVDEATRADIEAYLVACEAQGLAAGTRARRLSAIRSESGRLR